MGYSSKGLEDVTMTIEEYQTIKLIDLEGLTQEECAKSMEIARTTVQRIYTETGVDMILLVAEPTISGISDLMRIIDTANHFKVPMVLTINKKLKQLIKDLQLLI